MIDRKIGALPVGKVIQHSNTLAIIQKQVNQVLSNESGSTCNQEIIHLPSRNDLKLRKNELP